MKTWSECSHSVMHLEVAEEREAAERGERLAAALTERANIAVESAAHPSQPTARKVILPEPTPQLTCGDAVSLVGAILSLIGHLLLLSLLPLIIMGTIARAMAGSGRGGRRRRSRY